MPRKPISPSPVTKDWLIQTFKNSFDFTHKSLKIEQKEIDLLFIKTVTDNDRLQQIVIKPFFELASMEQIEAYLTSLPNQQTIDSKEQIELELTKGSVVIFLNEHILLFDFKTVRTDTVLESNIEPTIMGPQLALSEDIDTNLNLIRQRYHQPSLVIEMHEVGKKSHQSLAVIYDKDLVKPETLKLIKQGLKKLNSDVILSSAELVRFLNVKKRSLLPTMLQTERTDRITYNLSGGKIILLLDGDSLVILAPAVFFDFMTSMEDNYHPYWVTKFAEILRYIGLITCIIFPGLYVAIASYNPEVFRAELALSVAGSRIGVPYPSYVEVLFMLVVMELLTEASIRLPKAVSATATTVGGLILGTAATDAALTSNIMIIIVSAVAISTFVIPINEMSFSIRVSKYIILLFATFGGMAGLMLSFIGFIMLLSNKRSFGEPYFKMFIQAKEKETSGKTS
ncbi:spore germination protein [Bacillus sp. SD088]|uniref:spore germination protein n=1 Tax=Bacillus sp. SD088 TaxID=2782012 RepID=UPI001A975441|nr:spore germination protein [Bacillus sp. SD088]MBO0993911.1 spore germination protein [Bacillus sp. SD088]